MGTNYYTKLNECSKCGRYDEIHLGKSSAGWQFTFQYNGGQFYKNVKEMKAWLKNKNIIDEYGDPVTYTRFWVMVRQKQKTEFKNHAKEYPSDYDFVIEGYSFTDREFS